MKIRTEDSSFRFECPRTTTSEFRVASLKLAERPWREIGQSAATTLDYARNSGRHVGNRYVPPWSRNYVTERDRSQGLPRVAAYDLADQSRRGSFHMNGTRAFCPVSSRCDRSSTRDCPHAGKCVIGRRSVAGEKIVHRNKNIFIEIIAHAVFRLLIWNNYLLSYIIWNLLDLTNFILHISDGEIIICKTWNNYLQSFLDADTWLLLANTREKTRSAG